MLSSGKKHLSAYERIQTFMDIFFSINAAFIAFRKIVTPTPLDR